MKKPTVRQIYNVLKASGEVNKFYCRIHPEHYRELFGISEVYKEYFGSIIMPSSEVIYGELDLSFRYKCIII